MRGLAGSTVNQRLSVIRAAWRWGEERGLCGPLPRVTKAKARPTAKRPLTPAELGSVLEVAQGTRWYPILRVLADSGKRVSSVLNLVGADVHRGEHPWLSVVNGKTKRRERAYVLPETVTLLPDVAPTALVFVGARGQRLSHNSVNAAFHRLRVKAGLGHLAGVVDVHSVRRFVVDQHCQDGESIARGMRITGHSDPAVFLSYQRNAADATIYGTLSRLRARVATGDPSLATGNESQTLTQQGPCQLPVKPTVDALTDALATLSVNDSLRVWTRLSARLRPQAAAEMDAAFLRLQQLDEARRMA